MLYDYDDKLASLARVARARLARKTKLYAKLWKTCLRWKPRRWKTFTS